MIYFWWETGSQFWFFTLYGKDAKEDLGPKEKAVLRELLKDELAVRRKS